MKINFFMFKLFLVLILVSCNPSTRPLPVRYLFDKNGNLKVISSDSYETRYNFWGANKDKYVYGHGYYIGYYLSENDNLLKAFQIDNYGKISDVSEKHKYMMKHYMYFDASKLVFQKETTPSKDWIAYLKEKDYIGKTFINRHDQSLTFEENGDCTVVEQAANRAPYYDGKWKFYGSTYEIMDVFNVLCSHYYKDNGDTLMMYFFETTSIVLIGGDDITLKSIKAEGNDKLRKPETNDLSYMSWISKVSGNIFYGKE